MEKGIAIITGADGGMGREITLALAKRAFRSSWPVKSRIKPVLSAIRSKKKAGTSGSKYDR